MVPVEEHADNPFYWLIAPFYRRSERTTVGEIIEDRYGSRMGLFIHYLQYHFCFQHGRHAAGAAKVISVPREISEPDMVVLVMTIAFIVYSFAGGLIAAAYATDFIQSFLIIILSVMLIRWD
jgi:Na+/proline symporter